MDNRVWVKDAVMTIRLPEEVDHFVADRLREEAGEPDLYDPFFIDRNRSGACGRADAEDSGDVGGDAGD